MNLLRFNALADIVSTVRKYKCRASGLESRAEELSQLLVQNFSVNGKPALRSARLFFVPFDKVTDSAERAVVTDNEIRQVTDRPTKRANRKGTVMYLENSGGEVGSVSAASTKQPKKKELQASQDSSHEELGSENGAKVVATVKASDESQFVVTLEMTVQLAPDVAPYFRVLSSMLASKMTGNDIFFKDISEEWAELYEHAFDELSRGEFHIVEHNKAHGLEFVADDTDHFSEWSHSLAESLPLIVWTALPDGYVNFVNSKWADYTGLTSGDAYGKGWQRALHPDDFERATKRFDHCMKTGELFENEHRLLDLNTRQYRWFLAQGVPVRDRDGNIKSWFGTATDIDEQKRVNERLQFVMDTIPAAIFWKDKNSVYLGCNKTFANIAGLSHVDQIVGKTDFDMPWTADETEFYHLCDRKVMEENQPQFNILEPLTRKGGEVSWLNTSKMPMHDASGNVIGILAHFEDITKTIQLQSQREDFMASLAHDLKVPVIGAIRALDALLQGYVGPLDDKQTDFIQCLHRSHENLLLMVKNLLQVLRYESGKDQFIFEHFDLVGILNDCLKDSGPAMTAKHIHLEFQAPKKLILNADRVAVKALIVNLIGNAINSAPEHTQVKVNLEATDKQATLEVHNGGEPISEEDMEQLFQRLWQGKRFGAGAGLGLFLCRQIAEGHNGSMSCISSREEGTVMRFSLPITPASPGHGKQIKPKNV
ncbi:MAG: hypothetical protein DKT66_22700 [Candidatus Melainabacteria bacterium]|nr:MAG: hypothetical protein DKT66_22700 [Candidatus Melainabacteria bacterium]